MAAPYKMKGSAPAAAPAASPDLTPDSFMASHTVTPPAALTPDSFMAQQSTASAAAQPSVWQVLSQPTEKTDNEFMKYRGAAGVAGATVKGLDDVARGTEGAVKGIWDDLTSGHVPIIHSARAALANTVRSIPQIPDSLRDINASPDPLTHYADAAQDTVSQGAGQALTGVGMAGMGELANRVAPYVGPVGKALVKGYAKKVIPEEVGTAYKAVKTARANAPAPPTYPGAPLPEHPGEFPGAPLPETPPAEVLQAKSLATGGQPTPSTPAAALGNIPAPWRMKPQADALGELQTSASRPAAQTGEALGQVPIAPWRMKPQAATLGDTPQARTTISQQLDDTLRTAVGNPAVRPGVPMRYQFKSPVPAEGSVPVGNIPEGHTAVESSAVKSFKYDPEAQEIHIAPTKGYTYVYGDVSPEQAAEFQNADSKGIGWGAIRKSNPLVAKIHENGTRTAVTPTNTAPGEDLTRVLQQSVDAAQKPKFRMKAAQ